MDHQHEVGEGQGTTGVDIDKVGTRSEIDIMAKAKVGQDTEYDSDIEIIEVNTVSKIDIRQGTTGSANDMEGQGQAKTEYGIDIRPIHQLMSDGDQIVKIIHPDPEDSSSRSIMSMPMLLPMVTSNEEDSSSSNISKDDDNSVGSRNCITEKMDYDGDDDHDYSASSGPSNSNKKRKRKINADKTVKEGSSGRYERNKRDSDIEIQQRIRTYDPTTQGYEVELAGQYKFICNVCESILASKSGLFHHNLLHTGEKPYICKFDCGATFAQPTSRYVHEKNYHINPIGRSRRTSKVMKMDHQKANGNGSQTGEGNNTGVTKEPSSSPRTPASSASTSATTQVLKSNETSGYPAFTKPSPGPAASKLKPAVERKIIRKKVNNLNDGRNLNRGDVVSSSAGMSMSGDQFDQLKNFIRSSFTQLENRIFAKLDDFEDTVDDLSQQMIARDRKISLLEKRVDFLERGGRLL